MLSAERGHADVVGIPTGIQYHVPLAVQALDAGYNVLVEKPLAGTIQETALVRQAEQRSGRWCAVGYQFVYSDTIQWLAQRLASGDWGRLLEARSFISWPRPASYYARNRWAGRLRVSGSWILDGPATNATAHYLTNLLYVAGCRRNSGTRIQSVRAELYRAKPIESYDTSAIEIQLNTGARLIHLTSHAVTGQVDPVMVLECEGATIRWEAASNSALVRFADGRIETHTDPAPDEGPARQVRSGGRRHRPDAPMLRCAGSTRPHLRCWPSTWLSSRASASSPCPITTFATRPLPTAPTCSASRGWRAC